MPIVPDSVGHVYLPRGQGRTLVRGLSLVLPWQSGECQCENVRVTDGHPGHGRVVQQLCSHTAV